MGGGGGPGQMRTGGDASERAMIIDENIAREKNASLRARFTPYDFSNTRHLGQLVTSWAPQAL